MGFFLEETPSSLLNKLINDPEVLTKEYGYQGTLALIDIKEKDHQNTGRPSWHEIRILLRHSRSIYNINRYEIVEA
jgi:hypothetical protein